MRSKTRQQRLGTRILVMVTLGLGLCLSGPSYGESGTGATNPGLGGPVSDLKHDAEIRKLFQRFTELFNQHDAGAMAKLWALDGDHREPDGTLAKGRADVLKLFTAEHAGPFKASRLTLTIDSVWFVSGDVALVDGTYELAGVRDAKGEEVPTRKGHLTSLMLHEKGEWLVEASRLMIRVPLSWREG